MKRLFTEFGVALILLAALTVFSARSYAQSDCGNCWVAGSVCGYSEECIIFGIPCESCSYFVVCDYAPCDYAVGPVCGCGNTGYAPKLNDPAPNPNQPWQKPLVPAITPAYLMDHSPALFTASLMPRRVYQKKKSLPSIQLTNTRFWWRRGKEKSNGLALAARSL